VKLIFDPILVLCLPLHKLEGSSLKSEDACGHLCTVTGALWRPAGRLFDGSDDNILLPTATATMPATGTIIVWYNATSPPDGDYIYSRNSDELAVYADTNDVILYYDSVEPYRINLTVPSSGVWTCLGFTFTQGSIGYGYENGVQVASGSCSATAPAGTVARIGSNSAGTGRFYPGLIGEFLLYSRVLTPQEIQRHYLATKWRYQ